MGRVKSVNVKGVKGVKGRDVKGVKGSVKICGVERCGQVAGKVMVCYNQERGRCRERLAGRAVMRWTS